MQMIRCIVLIFALLLVSFFLYSQSCGEYTINEMRKYYQKGQFDNIIESCNECIRNGFESRKIEEEVYWILSKTYLEIGLDVDAEKVASKIISLNSNFEPESGDPEKFKIIISALKNKLSTTTVESVSKKAEKIIEAPATVMIITVEDIRNRGYTDIEQIFNDLPGFDISRTYGITYSNLYQRGYRSDNTERTLFLVDGVEESDLWSNIALISPQYSLSNIKQVEVVYGPASTMYGANALVGVVNIITKEPEDVALKTIIINKDHTSFLERNKSIGAIGAKVDMGYGSFNTRYTDLTFAAKKGRVSVVTTFRKYDSDVMDLSKYEDFNYDINDFDAVDYVGLLSVTNNAGAFIRNNQAAAVSPFYDIITNESGDTTALALNESGAKFAGEADKEFFRKGYNGKKIEYSNLSDQTLFYGKVKIDNLSIGYQTWRYLQGSTNGYGDYKRGPVDIGNVWEQSHSFFYVKYNKAVTDKIELINHAQYRITKADDETKTTIFYNYANKGLGASALINEREPYWYSYYSYTICRQFRDEFKVVYQPNTKFDVIGGVEVKNSIIQGDYRITTIDTASVIEAGTSSGDILPGGNDFNVNDLGIYAQGTYGFAKIFRLVVGTRYDHNRIRVTGGYESQLCPRLVLIATPGKFVLKGMYATAFQNASNWKKFSTASYRLLSNPNLAPERVRNYEFSVAYQPSNNFYLDLIYYNSFYEGVVGTGIVAYNGGTTQQNQAIGELKIQGLQSTFKYDLSKISFYANYSYTYPRNNKIEEGQLTDDFQRIADIAEHKFNVGVNVAFLKNFNFNARCNYVGKRQVGKNTTVPQNPGNFSAHSIFNTTLAYKYKDIYLQFICNNIFDTEYFDPGTRSADGINYAYRIPQKNRTFSIRLIYELK